MKYTLLELVQRVLESMDSDEVNSYDDTVESRAVANIIKETYFDIVSRLDLPEHHSLFELEASGTSTKPTLMYLPSTCLRLEWVKYNYIEEEEDETSPNFKTVKFLPLEEFLERMYLLNTDTMDNVGTFSHTVGSDTLDFLYENDKMPEYYTTFDDYTLVFDSYDVVEDTTLVKNKSLAFGLLAPTFTLSNNFTPDLDSKQFQLLLNESKALAHAELKQAQHAKAEQKARRLLIKSQKDKQSVGGFSFFDRLPNYGRKR